MGFTPGGDGRSDGGDIQGMRAKWRHHKRAKAGHRNNGIGAGVKTIIAKHQHPRHILPGQRDHKQRQGNGERGIDAELRPGQYRHRKFELQFRDIDPAFKRQHHQTSQQHRNDGVARQCPLDEQINSDQDRCQQRVNARRCEGADPELQQYPCQQTRRNTGGDQTNDLVEIARQAQQNKSKGRDHVGAHRLRIGGGGKCCDQECCSGRRPGRDDRGPVTPTEIKTGKAHPDRYRPDPGCGQFRTQIGGLGRVKDKNECSAIIDDHRNKARDNGMKHICGCNGWVGWLKRHQWLSPETMR